MPSDPRSWTANSSSASRTSASPCARARRDRVDPAGDRRLVVPAEILESDHPEPPDDAHRPGRMPLHQRRVEHLGEHDEVAFRAGRTVEHDPLVGAVGATKQPARQPVGEPTRGTAAAARRAACA